MRGKVHVRTFFFRLYDFCHTPTAHWVSQRQSDAMAQEVSVKDFQVRRSILQRPKIGFLPLWL